jgi:hypothetical protein
MNMRICLISCLALALLAASVTPASASPWNRSCGTPNDGFVFGPGYQWEVDGPFQVGMSYPTALSISRRVPSYEGYRPSARQVVCQVAQSIASDGAQAWAGWPGSTGVTGVTTIGPLGGPYLGRFSCVGLEHGYGTSETCRHRADRHAGAITGRFVIRNNPNYPYS